MKKKKLYIFFISLSVSGYAWLAWNVFETQKNHSVPTICIFKEFTHLPCPSCGTTRSLVLLSEGHFTESIMLNPFGMIIAVASVIILGWILTDVAKGKDTFYRAYLYSEKMIRQKSWIFVPAVTLIILNWIWNISKGL